MVEKLKVNAVMEDLKEALTTIVAVNKLKGVNALDLVGFRSTAYTVLLYIIHTLNSTLLCSHGTTLWGIMVLEKVRDRKRNDKIV